MTIQTLQDRGAGLLGAADTSCRAPMGSYRTCGGGSDQRRMADGSSPRMSAGCRRPPARAA
ncbi:hypothetical protein [Streptomyces tauricus]|uniref:hypothetical protein n=1 Tax=Streptomyces tauricus TaxID=68274 RepID=UPI0034131390